MEPFLMGSRCGDCVEIIELTKCCGDFEFVDVVFPNILILGRTVKS